jgi:hypothetical protein
MKPPGNKRPSIEHGGEYLSSYISFMRLPWGVLRRAVAKINLRGNLPNERLPDCGVNCGKRIGGNLKMNQRQSL